MLTGGIRLAGPAATLTDATFERALRAPAAVVDFWSPTCPHCVNYKPVFEDVASTYGDRVLVAAVNVNDAPESSDAYNIQPMPATVFLVNGREVLRVEGEMSKEELARAMTRAFGGMLGAAGPASPGVSLLAGVVGGLAVAGLVAFLATR
jgi:thioredoxin-like negative regulator of GroEL